MVTIPSSDAYHYFEAFTKMTLPIAMIALQESGPMTTNTGMKAFKSVQKAKYDNQFAEAEAIFSQLLSSQQHLLECMREKALPIEEHRFHLHKLRWPSSVGIQPRCWAPPHPETLTRFLLDKHTNFCMGAHTGVQCIN